MDAAQIIREAVSRVTDLRERANLVAGLRAATITVKGLRALMGESDEAGTWSDSYKVVKVSKFKACESR